MLIPIIMIVLGMIFSKHPPKEINGICGYRTTRSMKNLDTWKFANVYCGRLWTKIGFIILVPSFIVSIFTYWLGESGQSLASLIILTVQVIILIVSIKPVEDALKKNFDDKGKRR